MEANKNIKITDGQIKKINDILKQVGKEKMQIKGAIEWFDKVYIKQLSKFIDINDKILCDCACGYGWLSFAFLLNGKNNNVICIDIDKKSVEIARSIAEILEIDDRIIFKVADITTLPLSSKSVNIFACIETLEHVGENLKLQMDYYYAGKKDKVIKMFKTQRELQLTALKEIKRVTTDAVIIATPNRYYFKDHHDTGLKFVHWMPRCLGIKYSLKYSKEGYFHTPLHSRFLSHREVESILSNFKLVTPLFCFKNVEEYNQIFPTYYPYGVDGGVMDFGISNIKLNLLRMMFFILGKNIRYFLPKIDGIYIRKNTK